MRHQDSAVRRHAPAPLLLGNTAQPLCNSDALPGPALILHSSRILQQHHLRLAPLFHISSTPPITFISASVVFCHVELEPAPPGASTKRNVSRDQADAPRGKAGKLSAHKTTEPLGRTLRETFACTEVSWKNRVGTSQNRSVTRRLLSTEPTECPKKGAHLLPLS